jgi:hypothetical protein
MKRFTVIFALVVAMVGLPVYASAEGTDVEGNVAAGDTLTYLGANVGFGNIDGEGVVSNSALLGGVTIKHFFDANGSKLGIGGTIFSQTHKDGGVYIGNWEGNIRGATVDFMLANDAGAGNGLGYLLLSVGRVTYELTETTSGASADISSGAVGFGAGYLNYSDQLAWGLEVKYLHAGDLDSGGLQGYGTVGFHF